MIDFETWFLAQKIYIHDILKSKSMLQEQFYKHSCKNNSTLLYDLRNNYDGGNTLGLKYFYLCWLFCEMELVDWSKNLLVSPALRYRYVPYTIMPRPTLQDSWTKFLNPNRHIVLTSHPKYRFSFRKFGLFPIANCGIMDLLKTTHGLFYLPRKL